ncbi:unnamed protein product [Nippostrongylus brasiliensis]|uniref:FCS-type domain-containing protein n=1 Tax=Nippostrongylus brasiliensis TaxID=27835 RepID=A0A0N4YZD5_NIPBR|nr:unnamed protein product [Nippostrongylus brasiliensis]
MQKKAEDERKRRELLTLQIQQPFLAATIQAQAQAHAQAQANSLISNQHLLTQQNLLSQHFSAHNLLNQQALLQHQQLLAAQKFQEFAQRSLVQQQGAGQATPQQPLPAGISPAYFQQALGQVQGLLPGASAAVPGFNPSAPVTRGTPPVGNHLVFGQFAEPQKPQVQATSSQAQSVHVKPEAPSPQVSPAPQTISQQPYGLQNIPACELQTVILDWMFKSIVYPMFQPFFRTQAPSSHVLSQIIDRIILRI